MRIFAYTASVLLAILTIYMVRKMLKNERFTKNGIEVYGTVTGYIPTRISFLGIPQIALKLKYSINGKSYEGYTTLFTRRGYYLGTVVPIRVNPENYVECSVKWGK